MMNAPGGQQWLLRRRQDQGGFSRAVDAHLWQAARLSRQCSFGAKAESRARPAREGYTEQYANVHRGLHYLANEATEAYEGARETVRAFLNAGRKEEVIFTRNATEAINLVAYTFARERIKAAMKSCFRS
jgi:gamma-glutamyl:cysteine ligase YbdK (ATP-grasp superfamily)